jgi:rare lipoprotein A (peptidoglycan hydrolase)
MVKAAATESHRNNGVQRTTTKVGAPPAGRPDANAVPAATASHNDRARAGTGACPDANDARVVKRLRGQASYYSDALAGHKTASGQLYDPHAFTAAHRTLAFGTVLRVHRADGTGQSVCVRVNDRGPFAGKSRILDLSRAAAEALHMMRAGVAPVEVEILRED